MARRTLWWLIRPSTHYPTIELRLCDSCTRVEDTVAIASLYRCLVRCAVRRPDLNAGIGPIDRATCAENIWQVQRHGVGALLVDAARGQVPLADMLDGLLDPIAEDADALGCTAEVEATPEIVRNGTSAERQIASYRAAGDKGDDREGALRAVIASLAKATSV